LIVVEPDGGGLSEDDAGCGLQMSPDAALVVALLIIGFVIWAFLR
jgi:hypothetical protein